MLLLCYKFRLIIIDLCQFQNKRLNSSNDGSRLADDSIFLIKVHENIIFKYLTGATTEYRWLPPLFQISHHSIVEKV